MNKIIEEDLKYITDSKIVPWDMLEGKSIFIAGANGFVPSYLVYVLLFLNEHKFKKKTNIIALIRNPKNTKKFRKGTGFYPNLMFIYEDVCEKLKEVKYPYIPTKIDYIFHAASPASPKYFKKDPIGTILPNVIGTYNLLELARQKNISGFLYFSSGEIYGDVSTPLSENTYGLVNPLNPRSCYPESKRMGENLCACYHYQHNIPIKIARLFHTYGPGMKLDDGRMFADFTADAITRRKIQVKSDGRDARTLCYLADTIIALFLIMLKGKSGEAYNIANPHAEIEVGHLAQLIADMYGLDVDYVKPDNKTLQRKVRISIPDITKIEKLGWQPKYLLREGFKRTIESYEW